MFTTLGHLRTNLAYERRDSAVTLLKDDQVLFNLLTDLVTDKRRATNIRLQIPLTYQHTKETRLTVRGDGDACSAAGWTEVCVSVCCDVQQCVFVCDDRETVYVV